MIKEKKHKVLHKWNQAKFNKNAAFVCILINIMLLSIPIGFTLKNMGVFSSEPVITTAIQATDNAPVLRIVADGGFEPRSYQNNKGEPAGADVEVAIEAANRLGRKPKFVFSDWITARNTLNAGNADVILGLEIFSNMQGVRKTIPISSDSINVYGKEKVKDAASLAGKKVALMAKSVIIPLFDLNCEYVEYYTNIEILRALDAGNVDFAICHGSIANAIIKENHFNIVEGFQLMDSYPAMGVREGLKNLHDDLNRVLQEMANDGTIQKLENKWVKSSLNRESFTNVVQDNLLFYISYLVGMLIVEFLMVLFMIQSRYYAKSLSYNEMIAKANAAKTDFLSRVSHDMRTPMNGILGMTELARTENDLDKLHEDIEKIRQSGNYMLNLINDTLELQRIESGKLALNPTICKVNTIVESTLAMVKSSATEKGVKLQIENVNEDDVRYIRIDQVRASQIVVNLLSNAIKFTPAGGTVLFKIEEQSRDKEYIHEKITVADTGVGMSKEFMENKLFTPFAQEQNEMSMQYAGSGLGLSIVKSLLDLMGARIEVESELGNGTTFTIWLDFEQVPKEEAEGYFATKKTQTQQSKVELQGRKILLCEDHPLNAEITKRLLAKVGAACEWAKDGKEGVEMFKDHPAGYYDAVLMDIKMPNMDGIVATETIRSAQHADAKTIPIIAMSANAYQEDIDKSKKAGMNDHLAKPVTPSLLYSTLQSYLRKD